MFFGGIQKTSLIDYPGRISCVLFVSGCNFRCPYCHNPALARGELTGISHIDDKRFQKFLADRAGFLEGVVISGGEPTIHKDISSLCRKLKDMGYPVKLDTNGSRPDTLGLLLEQRLVDYVAMDIKADPVNYKTFLTDSSCVDSLLASINLIMGSDVDYEFRTTCAKPIIDEKVIKRIAATIRGAKLYALQNFRYGGILRPEFFEGKKAQFSIHELQYLRSIAEPFVEKCLIR